MYAWIDGEMWDGDGRPPLVDEHSYLWGPYPEHACYGRLLPKDENLLISAALVEYHFPRQPELPEDQAVDVTTW